MRLWTCAVLLLPVLISVTPCVAQEHVIGPFASLKEARDAVRDLKSEGPLRMPVRVLMANGTHPLTEPVVFTPEDSGTARCPITYEPEGANAKPVFTGGRPVTGFTAGENGLWTAHIPDVAEGKRYFEQLFVNGRRAVRARTPNRFYHYMQKKAGYVVDPATGKKALLSKRAFIARRKDIEPLLRIHNEKLNDVILVAYHSWSTFRHRIASVDPNKNLVSLTGPSTTAQG